MWPMRSTRHALLAQRSLPSLAGSARRIPVCTECTVYHHHHRYAHSAAPHAVSVRPAPHPRVRVAPPSSASASSNPSAASAIPKRRQSLLADDLQRIVFRRNEAKQRAAPRKLRSSPPSPAPQSSPSPSPASVPRNVSRRRLPSNSAAVSTSPPITPVDVLRTAFPPQLATALRPVVLTSGPKRLSAITSDEHFSLIPPLSNLRLSHLPPFLTSSRDPLLMKLTASHNALIGCSSSSTTSLLARFYIALVGDSRLDFSGLSAAFDGQTPRMTWRARAPVAATLRRRRIKHDALYQRLLTLEEVEAGQEPADFAPPDGDGTVSVWGLDRGFSMDGLNRHDVLMRLGHALEHRFTMEPDAFDAHFLEDAATPRPLFDARHAFLFSLANRTMMRSQLDCHDVSLSSASSSPMGVFDIKTRAVWPIRYDLEHYEQHTGYSIEREKGANQSFEKEWYDMARTVFLKYALQCRMGRMQGVLVAYHNTQTVFGVEMVSLEQMERTLLGPCASMMADRVYELSVRMLDEVTRRAVDLIRAMHGGRHAETIKLVVAQSEKDESHVHVFVELLPPPALDFDAHLPLTHRHATLYRLDQLDMPSLLRVAQAHGLEVDENTARDRLLGRLEPVLSSSTTRFLPPIAHVLRLLDCNLLFKLSLRVYHADADGEVLPGRWRHLPEERLSGVRSSYSLSVVDTQSLSEAQKTKLAWQYLKNLEAGFLLEREGDDDSALHALPPAGLGAMAPEPLKRHRGIVRRSAKASSDWKEEMKEEGGDQVQEDQVEEGKGTEQAGAAS